MDNNGNKQVRPLEGQVAERIKLEDVFTYYSVCMGENFEARYVMVGRVVSCCFVL